jgi:signal transduction histidine kinase
VWIGFFNGGIAWWLDGQVRAAYTVANGLGKGHVDDLRFDSDGTLWAATEGGLSRLKEGRIETLTSRNGLPCDAVQWSIEDNAQSVWLKMPCGLVRIARSELDAWATAPSKSIHPAVFDSSDGLKLYATGTGLSPRVAKSADGKLWFVTFDGISAIDPHRVPFNKLPPPVHVEQVIADRKTYPVDGKLRLPALTRDVEIDYTALSFVAPEKMRFRFKLEGRDKDWHEVVNRRQAFYDDLPPRDYRFRVMASNNDGVWNEAGASLDFSVDAAWYQTHLFQVAWVAAFLLLLAGLYQLRLRQVTKQFNVRMEERVNERTRIARDLHDTLLQSFQGVLLKFSAANFMLPERPVEAQQKFEDLIEQARAAISEGRDAVQGLRQSTLVSNDLVRSIGAIGEEFAAEQNEERRAGFRIQAEGESRNLPPIVRDEVYRIAIEAMRNAFRHAEARAIEVEIRYDPRQFRLRIRDDGKGIDESVLRSAGRSGHYGLPGMHERARLAGGKLAVWSRAGAGTELELTIPAAIAYQKVTVVPHEKAAP